MFFSRSTPSIAMVIPAMDHIDQHLTMNTIDPTRLQCKQWLQLESRPSTSIMVQLTIPKSIGLQWGCLFCAIKLFQLKLTLSLVLHLCHKLNYFKKAKWDAEWSHTSEILVQQSQIL